MPRLQSGCTSIVRIGKLDTRHRVSRRQRICHRAWGSIVPANCSRTHPRDVAAFLNRGVEIRALVERMHTVALAGVRTPALGVHEVVAYVVEDGASRESLDPKCRELLVAVVATLLCLGSSDVLVESEGDSRCVVSWFTLVSCADRTVDALKCNGLLYTTYFSVAYLDIGRKHTLLVDDDDDASSKRERLFLGLVAGRIDRGSNGAGEAAYHSRQR